MPVSRFASEPVCQYGELEINDNGALAYALTGALILIGL
jgi:hypothetical protein